MGLDDFAPAHARQGEHGAPQKSVHPDDEDLFDFPSIEMQSGNASLAKSPAPASHAMPIAPLPAKQPAIAKQPSTSGFIAAASRASMPPAENPPTITRWQVAFNTVTARK